MTSRSPLDRDNNFNLLRIIAATAVLISHAYPIALGPLTTEPLEGALGMSLGTLAVVTFFAISGYFISQSFHNRRSVTEFAIARALRIYPGLLVALALTVMILGPTFTQLSLVGYFSDWRTALYVPKNLLLWPLQYDLPGVFAGNHYPLAINGSLWTLAYEVACYAMVALVGLAGFAHARRRFVWFLLAYGFCYVAASITLVDNGGRLTVIRNLHLLSFPFVLGMAIFQFRHSPRLPVLLVLGATAAASYGTPWFREMFIAAWSYGIFYLGFAQFRPALAYNRLGDYSYGMYIYAFPVEQMVAAVFRDCTPVFTMLASAPLTFAFAIVSWRYIEKPALAKKAVVASWIARPRNISLEKP